MNASSLIDRVPAPLRRPAVLIALAGVFVLVGVLFLRRPSSAGTASAYHEVRRGTFTVSVTEGGNIAAVNEVSIRNEVEGSARIVYIVPEGSFVKKDQLLVELDSAQAQDQVNQQQIAFEKAQFALVQAQAQLDIQRSTTNSDIRAAELKLEFAKLDLEKFLKGEQMVLLTEASNKLVQASAQLVMAADKFINTTNLAAKGYETKLNVNSDELSLLSARNSLTVASNQIWILRDFTLKKDLATLTSGVEEAQKELERVIAQSERRIAQYEADLITQSNTLIFTERKLDRDRRNLEKCKIHAPQDGLVVYPFSDNRFSSESLIEEGASVRNRQELIKLPDTSRMKVTIKVHESHVNMVRPGLPAFVVLDSMPDRRFAGHVDRVALLPDTGNRWGNPNLKVYNTDVHITDPLPDVKPGVSAKAEVIITNIENALSVPIQAVTTHKGRQVVYRVAGGDPVPTPVEVGLYNSKFIEIVSGLKEGDRVLLAPPFDAIDKDLEGSVLTAEEKAKVVTTNAPPPASPARPQGGPDTGIRSTTTTGPSDGPPVASRDAPPSATPGEGPESRGRGGRNPGNVNFQEMVAQYDKDGDGQLNDEEREAMRTAMAARFGGQGGPGGGQGGQGGPRFNREEMLKQWDKDGDGQLSDEERDAMRQAFGGGRGNRGGGGGPGSTNGGGRQGRSDAPDGAPRRDRSPDGTGDSTGGNVNGGGGPRP